MRLLYWMMSHDLDHMFTILISWGVSWVGRSLRQPHNQSTETRCLQLSMTFELALFDLHVQYWEIRYVEDGERSAIQVLNYHGSW